MNKKPSKNFQFFLDNVKEWEKEHKDKYVVIKRGKVLAYYDTFADGVRLTVEQGHKAGGFSVQRVNSDPATYTVNVF